MSNAAQTKVWESALTGSDMLVMQALADIADDDGMAYPSMRYLAWKTGLALSTIVEIIKRCAAESYLVRLTGTPGTSTRYRIQFDKLPHKDPWPTRKGRLPGESGRTIIRLPDGPPVPTVGTVPVVGTPTPVPIDRAPVPIDRGTCTDSLRRNKEDTSLDPSKNPQLNTGAVPAPRKRSQARQFPKSFAPNANNQLVAEEEGVDLVRAVAAFRDYHQSKGSVFKDWNLALNTWIRNDRSFHGKTNGNGVNRAEQRKLDNLAAAERAKELLRERQRLAGN